MAATLARLADLGLAEIDALTRSLAARLRGALDDADTVLAAPRHAPAVLVARFADLARSNWFRGVETALDAPARLGRIALTAGLGRSSLPMRLPRQMLLSSVAIDVYLGYVALRERARWWPRMVQPDDWELQHRRGAARLAESAMSLGGLLIKAGQLASARPDLLPAAYVERLAALQDRVPARPWMVIEPALTAALGRPSAEVFETIEPVPMAAASLAQVHRGRLRDGHPVAVKVQYPDVADLVAADLTALASIADAIARIEPAIRLHPIVDALRATVPRELDFRQEATAMASLRSALAHRDDVVIPAPVQALSSERLLVMELVEGIKVTDRAALVDAGIDPGAVARRLDDVYADQILRAGLLHGDPHPGNVLVQPGPRLVLLDHGLTVPIPPPVRTALARAVRALVAGDLGTFWTALESAGLRIAAGTDAAMLLGLIGLVTGEVHRGAPAAARSVAVSVGAVPVELLLVGRALGLLHGITRQLDPTVDALEAVARHAGAPSGS